MWGCAQSSVLSVCSTAVDVPKFRGRLLVISGCYLPLKYEWQNYDQ